MTLGHNANYVNLSSDIVAVTFRECFNESWIMSLMSSWLRSEMYFAFFAINVNIAKGLLGLASPVTLSGSNALSN